MNGLHIFLDTSVLYKDPFFKGNFSSKVLSLAKMKSSNVYFYMSRIVLDELVRNYEKVMKGEIDKLEKIVYDSRHYNFNLSSNVYIDGSNSIDGLKRFYQNLYNEGVLEIIDHEDSMMSEMIYRSVNRIKPFSDNKNELKDALTWLVYSKFVEEYELNSCYLMTDNVSDFCDVEKLKKGTLEIHVNLLSDTKRFKVCRSFKEFVQNEEQIISEISLNFKRWLDFQDFDSIFVSKMIKSSLGDDIKTEIKNKFTYYNLNYLFDLEYDAKGFVSFGETFTCQI